MAARVKFDLEWEDAQGVREPALAATWARMAIWIDGECITRVLDERSGSTRNGVYGSVLPFAEWIVENWWFISAEAQKTEHLAPIARLASVPALKTWVHRHNSYAARSGGALPDLYISRSGEYSAMAWYAEQPRPNGRPVRFLSQGSALLPFREVQEAMASLVTAVEERFRDCDVSYREEFFANWKAIQSARARESSLYERMARLGVDAYDADGDDSLMDLLGGNLGGLSDSIIDDIVDVANPADLECVVTKVAKTVEDLRARSGCSIRPIKFHNGYPPGAPPYSVGYQLARQARKEVFGLAGDRPFTDFRKQVSESLNWPAPQQCEAADLPEENVFAVIGTARDGSAHLLSPLKSFQRGNFLIARAIYHLNAGDVATAPVALTPAHVYRQQIGRSFAAELLAPAEALAMRIRRSSVTAEEIGKYADEFSVAPQVIQHQIENHTLADVEPT
jgi:BMFP domain-containing protein YqiC